MKKKQNTSTFKNIFHTIKNGFVRACQWVWGMMKKIGAFIAGLGIWSWLKRVESRMKPWHKIVTAVVGIIILGLIIWAIIAASRPDNSTRYSMSVSYPSPVSFRDNKPMNFMVNDPEEYSDTPVSVPLPEPNNDREVSDVENLYIIYSLYGGAYVPALRANLTDSDLEKGIKITPFIKGKWGIRNSERLVFVPARDWPADQKFTVTVDKKLFNRDAKINEFRGSFSTAPLNAKMESFDVYPDLTKQKSMVAIGVVSFNYSIDTKTLADKISMKLDGKKIDFTVKFDSFYRTAFITSQAITVKDKPQKVRMNISGADVLNGNSKSSGIEGTVTIESEDNFFKISGITTQIVDNPANEPEQLILVDMTSMAKNAEWAKYMNVYLLPQKKDESKSGSHSWKQDEITDEVLKKSKKLNAKYMDFANPTGVYQYAFKYNVHEKETRYIYVSVKSGVKSDIGFTLKNGSTKIMRVPYPQKEVKIAGSGNLLSLSGGKQLAIMARGGADAAYINLYKVRSSEINHLISQTYNIFSSEVSFKGYSFGAEDISAVFSKKISFADTSFKKVNYSSVDLGEYLNRSGNDRTGIFLVQVGTSQNNADYNDKKLILMTDMGIIRKVNSDGSSSIFVSSLGTGRAISGARVQILGRNGTAVWSGETDWNGRANAPKLSSSEYKREKEPVAFVVTSGSDVSFIPYEQNYDQRVEFSKFDIDGVHESNSNPMNAYLFSDRGIYRPGEKFTIGGIVKEKKYKSLAGIPVKIEIRDARSKLILEKTFSLTSDGLFDVTDRLAGTAPIGDYQIRLYSLNDKNKNKNILGTTNIRVEEFVPDTLKISASIANAKTKGWIKTSDLAADVSLRNLFGTPAQDRRIASRVVLTPAQYSFDEYKYYQFTQNFVSNTKLSKKSGAAAETTHQTLSDVRTDKEGKAKIDIKFDNNINPGTYVMSFTAEGFEGDSGRSVQAAATTRVSDVEYLVGYKASDKLAYVNKGAKRSINVIAINSDAKKIDLDKVTLRVVKKQVLTSLVKDYNDYYKYQTVTREKVMKSSDIKIPARGMDINLDTSASGNYYAQIIDKDEKVLAHVEYFVAGSENLTLKSDQQAELKIRLNRDEYAPGSDIEVSITSPYIGAGLITIEKDKVYAHKWFKTDTTSSVQRITLPDDFEGTGYINVSFVRDINSRDVFTMPYTYAVAPFAADKSKRTIKVDLKTPEIVRDKKLRVSYTTDKSARMMIFAVNEGILQVAKYKNPKPIDHFFKKSALQVSTYQILSLLLPEYKILREFAKTGGGDFEEIMSTALMKQNVTNPFARVVDEPVAFYSGIVETVGGVPNVMTFDIPDYFNGGVRVYAVAASNNAMGSAVTESKIQSPVIISASAPLMAVPGDEFTVNAVISNMTEKSGKNAKVNASVTTSDNLKVIGENKTQMDIPEISEKLWMFTLKTNNMLGNADINITASVLGGDNSVMSSNTSRSTLSIRPASLFETNIITDYKTDKKFTIKDFRIDAYKQMSSKELYISDGSFVLVKPLFEYLNNYQYSCSEQTVSKALPYALFPNNEFLGTDMKKSADKVNAAINILKNRQNDDGSFNLYEGRATSRSNEADASSAYVTSYVVQFLTIAKDSGFNVPSNMLSRAVDYLRTYSGKNIKGKFDADTHAFAIYLVSRNGYVTTSYIEGFEEYANKNDKEWQNQLSGAYIASAYKLMKQNDKANSIIKKYKTSTDAKKFTYYYDFSNNVANDAAYAYLVNAHFDQDISKAKFKDVLKSVQGYIERGYYSSFTSAASVMALVGAVDDSTKIGDTISVTGTAGKNSVNLHPVDSSSKYVFKTEIPNDVTKLDIECKDCNRDKGVFYTVVQQGFPLKPVTRSNGIDIGRDYYNKDGEIVTRATVGDELTVKVNVRTNGNTDSIDNVVIVDLLPAGFAVVSDSVSGSRDFHEVREDRVIVYKSVSRESSTITYKVKVTASGTFQVPGIQAASMYNPQISGAQKSGTFKVANAKVE